MQFINNFIYINDNSISKILCKEIINMFEEQDGKRDGITIGGLNKNVKDTIDYVIPRNNDELKTIEKWSKIDKFLEKELNRNIKLYIRNLHQNLNIEEEYSNSEFRIFSKDFLTSHEFMIQKYTQNKGRYVYHNDESINWNEKKYRAITYIFYLNDVEEGGETEIWNDFKIKPKAGKLLLFPSSWVFPHRGKMPKSSDKYIITGWLWINNQ